ncbi:MAG TPA: hypothetical protein GXZ78_04490, partial [Eubacteriaceae bacterium]|nr:hypothetical protein [Eubacteriaceae bacterium]
MKNLLSLYLFITIVAIQFFVAYFYSKSRFHYRTTFLLLTICISIYLFGYLMILNNNLLEEMIFWNQFQYIVLPFIPALWLLLTLQFTNTSYFIKKPYIFLMFLIPIITFFIRLTNSIHYFFYQGYQVKPFLGYNTLDMERGPWFY